MPTLATQVKRIIKNIGYAYNEVGRMGGTVPPHGFQNSENLSNAIKTIPQGEIPPEPPPPQIPPPQDNDFFIAIAYSVFGDRIENPVYEYGYILSTDTTALITQGTDANFMRSITVRSTPDSSDSITIQSQQVIAMFFGSRFNLTLLPQGWLRRIGGWRQIVEIPEGVVTTSSQCFGYLSQSVVGFKFPNSLRTVGDWNFSAYSARITGQNSFHNAEIDFGEGVTTIGEGVLHGVTCYTKPLKIPESIRTIGGSFFTGALHYNHPIVIPEKTDTVTFTCPQGSNVNNFQDLRSFNHDIKLPSNIRFTALGTGTTFASLFNGAWAFTSNVTCDMPTAEINRMQGGSFSGVLGSRIHVAGFTVDGLTASTFMTRLPSGTNPARTVTARTLPVLAQFIEDLPQVFHDNSSGEEHTFPLSQIDMCRLLENPELIACAISKNWTLGGVNYDL